MQQRCQWSAAKAGVTSALRLHDATTAYLSMKHDVAKQAANEMALRISSAVVTISGEEGEIHILARSGIWNGDCCAPRTLVKATGSAFQPELEALEKKGILHALLVETCPITGRSMSPVTTGYVEDFACHLLGAGVFEPERWRPPAASCPRGDDTTRSGRKKRLGQNTWRRSGTRCKWKMKSYMSYGHGRSRRNSARHVRECGEREPAQAEEAIDLEKEWNELLEDWEDAWAGIGLDDADAALTEDTARIHHPKERGQLRTRQEENGSCHTVAASVASAGGDSHRR